MTQRQAVNAADTEGVEHQGERTFYVYDAMGQRVRKVTELAGGQVKEERIYLGGFEVYRRNGASPLARETLHIMDDKNRIGFVETRTSGNEAGIPRQLIRYQFGNHLGSAALELDHEAQIVSYEEYTPYGSTSYQAVRSQTETPKRYRYTGKERDEESGFYYHGARYYVPWISRWISCDPAGIETGCNLYCYCRNNPVTLIDSNGRTPFDPHKDRLFGRVEKFLFYRNDTPVLDAITNDKNLENLQIGIAVGTVSTIVALGTGGASVALEASAIEAGLIGGASGGLVSAYHGASIQGRLPTTQEVVTDTLVGAGTGGGFAAIESKVIPAVVNRVVATPKLPPPAIPKVTPPAAPAKPATPPAVAAPAPVAPPVAADPQLSLFPNEPPPTPKAAPGSPAATGPEIPYQIDIGEVKSTNWSADRTFDYQGKFVFQESLDLKPGRVQASLRYTLDAKVIVELRELGGMEEAIGQRYVLDLDPAVVARETVGLRFGTSPHGNAMEPIVNQRVGQATGQTPVIRPAQQGGADFLPLQLKFPLMGPF